MNHWFAPNFFYKWNKVALYIAATMLPFVISIALYYALWQSPEDYQQGQMVRVMYVHVPAAWMSILIYSFVAICSFSTLVWETKLMYVIANAAAPAGALFALITLLTGSLWGKPIWGTWWVWDARLTSMLVLFLLYCSYMAIVWSGKDIMRARKPASIIAVLGFINVPIIKFSVDIWYSLHQPASIFKAGGASIHKTMLIPLCLMFCSFALYFVIVLILEAETILKQQKLRHVH